MPRAWRARAGCVYQCPLPPGTEHGSFFAPRAFEIDSASRLEREVFGPILHVVRWRGRPARRGARRDRRDRLRPDPRHPQPHRRDGARTSSTRLGVGNIYVNRNMIGAVVGVQPFGGERLCGTGPKAGGPHYLHRFATERTLSIDTTAAGGNATLLSLTDPDR